MNRKQEESDSHSRSVRNEVALLQGQASAEMAEIKRLLGSLRGGAVGRERLESALSAIAGVKAQLAHAASNPSSTDFGTLGQLAGVLGAEIGVISASEQSADESASMLAAGLGYASDMARATVLGMRKDLFEDGMFDSYLRFTSAEDERAYRQERVERERYVDRQLARNTPEGNLNAMGGAQSQMLSDAEHHANMSPRFHERWEASESQATALRSAVIAAGGSTAEYDRMMEDRVRHFLHSKGISDSEIEARIARNRDHITDAVEDLLQRTDQDSRQFVRDYRSETEKDLIGYLSAHDSKKLTEIASTASLFSYGPYSGASPAEGQVMLASTQENIGAALRGAGVTQSAADGQTPTYGLGVSRNGLDGSGPTVA